MELRNYLPTGWNVCPTEKGVMIVAPTKDSAQDWADWAIAYLRETILGLNRPLEVVWRAGQPGIRLTPQMVQRSIVSEETVKTSQGSVQARFDIDLNTLYQGANPVYINDLQTQTNLWCNTAALQAQGKKPQEFLIVQSAFALNYEDELDNRCRQLRNDGRLVEYAYQALRWFQETDTSIWRRRKMQFVSNFWKVEYLSEQCWLGEVLQATPLEQFAVGEIGRE